MVLVTVAVAHRCNSPELIKAAVAAGAPRVEIDAGANASDALLARHDRRTEGVHLEGLLGLASELGLAVTVDLKCPPAAVPRLCRAIQKAGLEGNVLLSGSLERPWREIRALLPGALLGWSPPEPGRWERSFRRGALQGAVAASAPAVLREKGLDVLLVHHSLASEQLASSLHGDERRLHAWTVNRAGRARRLARLGVDAVVTDRPREIAAELIDG